MVTLAGLADSAMDYIQQKRYSGLETIGYTPSMVDQFTGTVNIKTPWHPDLKTGKPVHGAKYWSGVEWWIFNEWYNKETGSGIALSPTQQRWANAWTSNDVIEFIVSGGRDSGKSWLGSLFTLHSMTFLSAIWPDYLVSLFAGSKEQTGTVYEAHVLPSIVKSHHIQQLVSKYDPMWEIVTERKKIGTKSVEMKFLNGSRLLVNSTSTKAARSKHPDLLWVDEAVEAEDVQKGNVISSAMSSLTAGHHMRILGTSTVHKNPNGWFAKRIRRAESLQRRGETRVFYINLSEAGFKSKTWVSDESIQQEFALKSTDSGIDLDSEFFGNIIGAGGDVFHQEALASCMAKSTKPEVHPKMQRLMGHDPGFGTSYYFLNIVQFDDYKVEVLYSEFFWRNRLSGIMDRVKELTEEFYVDMHGVDANATSTIGELLDRGFEAKGYQFSSKPVGWDKMLPDDQERFNSSQKKIGINFINQLLDQDRFRMYPQAGCYKPYDIMPQAAKVWGNEILHDQMKGYKENPDTGMPLKGNDDGIDSLIFSTLPICLGDTLGGFAKLAGGTN